MDDLSEAAVQARFSFLGGALKWAAFKWPAFKWPASVLRQSTAVAAVDITDATDTTKFSVTEQQDSTALALTQGSSGIASSPNQGKQPDSSGATAVSVHATSIPRHNQVLPAMSIQPESLGAQQRQLAWESEATPTSAPSTVWEIQPAELDTCLGEAVTLPKEKVQTLSSLRRRGLISAGRSHQQEDQHHDPPTANDGHNKRESPRGDLVEEDKALQQIAADTKRATAQHRRNASGEYTIFTNSKALWLAGMGIVINTMHRSFCITKLLC